jgi:hypothetical protein
MADHNRELQRNTQLSQASSDRQNENLVASRARVIERMLRFRGVLFKSFMSMVSAVGLAFVVKTTGYFIPTSAGILSVVSVFFFAWATLGRLGWSGQSYKGDTSVELLDQYLFHFLYWLGMYFAAAAIL